MAYHRPRLCERRLLMHSGASGELQGTAARAPESTSSDVLFPERGSGRIAGQELARGRNGESFFFFSPSTDSLPESNTGHARSFQEPRRGKTPRGGGLADRLNIERMSII